MSIAIRATDFAKPVATSRADLGRYLALLGTVLTSTILITAAVAAPAENTAAPSLQVALTLSVFTFAVWAGWSARWRTPSSR